MKAYKFNTMLKVTMVILSWCVMVSATQAVASPLLPFADTGDLFVLIDGEDDGSGSILSIAPDGTVSVAVTNAQIPERTRFGTGLPAYRTGCPMAARCPSRSNTLLSARIPIKTRRLLTPPLVDPAMPPRIISCSRINRASVGHPSKSAVA